MTQKLKLFAVQGKGPRVSPNTNVVAYNYPKVQSRDSEVRSLTSLGMKHIHAIHTHTQARCSFTHIKKF